MAWLVFVGFLLVPALLMAVALRRVVLVARRFRDPESLGELLSPEVRAALDREHIGLDAAGMERLNESEELSALVVADLRRAFARALIAPTSGAPTRTLAPLAVAAGHLDDARPGALRAPDRTAVPGLPPPIDAASTAWSRGARLAALVIGVTGALVWWLARG